MQIPFDNTYARLPARFFSKQAPTPVAAPQLIRLNHGLASELGIDADWLASPAGIAVLAGNAIATGSEPIAQAYAGHQFANFVPQLGDGRAILLGEVINAAGARRDIQLKGPGPTPYSRRGDGRAALGPVLREYIVSEAMTALGVPSTRALAAVASGETVYRETALPGAIFTRIAASHLRVGTFQFFAARQDTDALRVLTDYAIARHYPDAATAANPALAFLEAVIKAQCDLVTSWLHLGFIHGVMNTDNVSISGETLDFGPCAFMDDFHPQCVFSAIDRNARYAWGNQPAICQWNLTRLAETLLPLLSDDTDEATSLAETALAVFPDRFHAGYLAGFRRKLGLPDTLADGGAAFIKSTLATLANQEVDYTQFFRQLTRLAAGESDTHLVTRFTDPSAAATWLNEWRTLTTPTAESLATMRATNPIIIPRNHRVEEAIQAALKNDYAPFNRLVDALANPFTEDPTYTDLEAAPAPEERVTQTFCGT
jgi:uncharacterized protein YdiU (UPF0061 family)